MSQQILLKRSATPGKVPSTTDIALGEVGINTYDGKLYIQKNDGTASIVEVGGNGANFTVKSASFTALAGTPYLVDTSTTAVTVTLPASPIANDTITIVDHNLNSQVNNITIVPGSNTINKSASNLVLNYNGASVQLTYLSGNWIITDTGAIVNNGYISTTEYTATAAQTTFSVTYPYPTAVMVSVNGVQLSLAAGDYTAASGTSVVLANASVAGDLVKFVTFANIGSYPNVAAQEFTATAGQTAFSFVYNAANGINALQVFKNGVQLSSSQYVATDGLTVNLTSAAALNDKIKLISIAAASVSQVNNVVTAGMFENAASISANYTVGTGNNALSAGPITISNGAVVSVPAGSVWSIV